MSTANPADSVAPEPTQPAASPPEPTNPADSAPDPTNTAASETEVIKGGESVTASEDVEKKAEEGKGLAEKAVGPS